METEMLRTVMEMLHYPHLKFFVTLQKETQKLEKKRKKRNKKKKKHLFSRFVKIFRLSENYLHFLFTYFFYLISERS